MIYLVNMVISRRKHLNSQRVPLKIGVFVGTLLADLLESGAGVSTTCCWFVRVFDHQKHWPTPGWICLCIGVLCYFFGGVVYYQVVPGPRRGGSFVEWNSLRNQWPVGKFLRCRSNEALKLRGASTNEQIVVDMRMKWHERIHAQVIDWTNEPTNQWMVESLTRWTIESRNQCCNSSMIQGINASINVSVNQRPNAWVKKWVDESENQWINEAVSQRAGAESTYQWVNESMRLRIS